MMLLSSMLGWLKHAVAGAIEWLWDNPIALASMVGAVAGAWFMWKRSTNKIASLEDAVQVQAARISIVKKTVEAEALEARAEDTSQEVQELKREIVASQKRVVEIHNAEAVEGKTDEEIANLFSAAGL